MARKPKATRRGRISQPQSRSKVDPRLGLLLSLQDQQLRGLKAAEDTRMAALAKDVKAAAIALAEAKDNERDSAVARLRDLDRQLFAPVTAGLSIPSAKARGTAPSFGIKEPFVAAFILCDASAADLKRLGVRVRSQAGDIFCAFIPLSAIPKLERSAAIHYIELARPLFRTLDQAVQRAQIDTLHNGPPSITGAGVVVGIIDTLLDVYHPDFRTATGATRVLFLWDQTLIPQATAYGNEAGPPIDPALSGFVPRDGVTYGVEYDQAAINAELASPNPYQIVRHGGSPAAHGSHVAGIAAGNGLGQGGTYTGAAPRSDIIFVSNKDPVGTPSTELFGDTAGMADGFAYIFARATQLGQPCVVNMSQADNQGPHDGTTLGEQFLDNLLLTPGRAITIAAGNSNATSSHAAGTVPAGATSNLVLAYTAGAVQSDDVEIWYDGHDRFNVTVTVPTALAPIGPVAPGDPPQSDVLPNGVGVQVTSVLNDPRNGDNFISIIFTVPPGKAIPAGNTTISLNGVTVINGAFQAWVDRNNRTFSSWTSFLQDQTLNIGVPSTARRLIAVGNHDKVTPTPAIHGRSSSGPTRDGRIKPEIAGVGTNVRAPRSRGATEPLPIPANLRYTDMTGTSMSAPLVAGACACLLECRGPATNWANLKQILEDLAGVAGGPIPNKDFGFGFMRVAAGCDGPVPVVDVWLRDNPTDTGIEPFTGEIAWLSPDIEVLDTAGNTVPNPTHDPANRFNNIIRVTVRNRGSNVARNTEVYLYWADPATNIPYPGAWNTSGIYNDSPAFVNQSNVIVVPQLAAGASAQVRFGWAPPAPGSNIRGDDHFCLLVRLESEGDPSRIGAGGWSIIAARNNIGLHNLHVQPDDGNDAQMSFYMVGSADQDSLIIYPQLAGGRVSLLLPVQALPWRDIALIEQIRGPRPAFGWRDSRDPLAGIATTLKGAQVAAMTDIVGAELLELRKGVAEVMMGKAERLHLPYVRIAEGARMVAKVRVSRPKTEKGRRFVHIAQHSGGQLVGGVSLELRRMRR